MLKNQLSATEKVKIFSLSHCALILPFGKAEELFFALSSSCLNKEVENSLDLLDNVDVEFCVHGAC